MLNVCCIREFLYTGDLDENLLQLLLFCRERANIYYTRVNINSGFHKYYIVVAELYL